MKTILILIFTLSMIFVKAQLPVHIGISQDELKSIYTNMEVSVYEKSSTYTRPDTLYGLDSEWGYRFNVDTLNWVFFMKYIDDINDSNFQICLNATEKIIKDYSKVLGTPDSLIVGDKTFIDPYEKRHWGYDVLEARWYNAENMKIKVRFSFLGGKGDYQFLLSIDFFDQSYNYF